VQIRNCEWSLAFFENLLNDKRLQKLSYENALTVMHHSSREAQKKIKIVPLELYASFELNNLGPCHELHNVMLKAIMPQHVTQWEPGDWAMGVATGMRDEATYQILKRVKI